MKTMVLVWNPRRARCLLSRPNEAGAIPDWSIGTEGRVHDAVGLGDRFYFYKTGTGIIGAGVFAGAPWLGETWNDETADRYWYAPIAFTHWHQGGIVSIEGLRGLFGKGFPTSLQSPRILKELSPVWAPLARDRRGFEPSTVGARQKSLPIDEVLVRDRDDTRLPCKR
jgi:hypothetical protein